MAQQFDPVAGAALGALNSAQNGLRRFQNQTNAPQLPAQANVLNTVRQGISTVAQFSPFNVLARGRAPSGLPALPSPFGESAFEVPQPPSFGGGGGGGGSDDGGGGSGGGAFE